MKREVSLLANHPHPLIIKLIDSFTDLDGNAYMVIEFAENFDLLKAMKNRFGKKEAYPENESQNIIF